MMGDVECGVQKQSAGIYCQILVSYSFSFIRDSIGVPAHASECNVWMNVNVETTSIIPLQIVLLCKFLAKFRV